MSKKGPNPNVRETTTATAVTAECKVCFHRRVFEYFGATYIGRRKELERDLQTFRDNHVRCHERKR